MKKFYILAIIVTITSLLATNATFGQTTGEYRSRQSGNWNSPGPNGTWEQWNGTAWVTQNQTGTSAVAPTVEATAAGVQNTAGTSHSITLPSGITAGDLLLVVFSSDGNPTVNINTGVSGNNWTKLGQTASGTAVVGAIFWKVAEGSDVLTLTTTASETSSHISYRISGGTVFNVYGTSATGGGMGSQAANPPSLSPAPGSAPYLWIATASRDANIVATGAPTDYSGLLTQASTGGGSTSAATRSFTGTNQNPGNFTGNSTEEWVAYTLAVYSTEPVYTPIAFPSNANSDNPAIVSPVVAATNTSTKTTTGNGAHTVALPSGIQAGDLLLIFYSEADGTNTDPSFSGFTLLYSDEEGGDRYRGVWYKVATGTEGATISGGTYGGRSAHTTYRIAAGTYSGVPVASTLSVGDGTSANPPSLTSGFGAVPTLWIAACHAEGTGTMTAPANYTTNFFDAYTGNTGDAEARMGTSYRVTTSAASEDPAAYGLGTSNRRYVAATIAIKGGEAAVATVRNGHSVTVTSNVAIGGVTTEAGSIVTVNDGVTMTAPADCFVNVYGTLQMGANGSAVINGAGNFSLQSGATIGITSTVGLTNTGSHIQTTSSSNSGGATYIYNGNAAQVTGAEVPSGIANLVINNAAGVTLTQALTVNGVVTLTNGILTTGTPNLLTISASGSVSGASDASFVDGPVRKTGAVGTTVFNFPVGKTGVGYMPIGIANVTGATTQFTAQYYRASAKTTFGVGGLSVLGLQGVSNCEYWTLDRAVTTATADITMYWNAHSPCNGNTYVADPPLGLRIVHFNTGTNLWDAHGGGSISGTSTAGSVTWANVANFSPFALGALFGSQSALPVMYANVKAYAKNSGVQVEWTNLTERDLSGYDVQRSADGVNFVSINYQLPKSNLNDKADYTYFDATPLSGTNYYRIKAAEITGKIVYTQILRVELGNGQKPQVSMYPNPVRSKQVTVGLSNLPQGQYTLRVVNAAGQDVLKQVINNQGTSTTEMIQLPASIKPGVYTMLINGSDFRDNKLFVVQ